MLKSVNVAYMKKKLKIETYEQDHVYGRSGDNYKRGRRASMDDTDMG